MKEKKNELVIVEDISKRLQKRREEVIFPLSPTHRKELRELKSKNLGNIRHRLHTIKSLKRDEYLKKYEKEIEKEFVGKEKICKLLNEDWINLLKKIDKLLEERKKLELKFDMNHINIVSGYSFPNLNPISNDTDYKRRFDFKQEQVSKNIATEEFEKAYGKFFVEVSEKIDDLETKYEEAINFGDLEIVKELYYTLKNSDNLFKKISELKI